MGEISVSVCLFKSEDVKSEDVKSEDVKSEAGGLTSPRGTMTAKPWTKPCFGCTPLWSMKTTRHELITFAMLTRTHMALQLGTTTATCGRANVTFALPAHGHLISN